jgi:capsular polysaccharide biosynthesis protein
LDLREIDFFYIGEGPFNNFQKETLVKSGISIERVIQRACRADRLVVAIPSRTRFDGYALIDKNTYSFTRGLFHKDDDSNKYLKKGRIYVTRGQVQRRRFINELEVIELLKQYDFETVVMDGKTVQAQADFFCQSEAIIAPHGAALTNLLFINPGVKVIELFPYNYTPKYYQVMASYGGADYFYIKGEKLDSENRGNHPSNQTDILIDIEKLRIFCKDIFNN